MEVTTRIAMVLVLVVAISVLTASVIGRSHRHLKHVNRYTAQPPAYAPAPSSPAVAPRQAVPGAPVGAVTVYNVRDFGAAGDGVTDDTDAFKTAWDAACQDGRPGVAVVAPARLSFLVHATVFAGPCQGSLTLQVDGTIVAPSDPVGWPAASRRSWLVFYRADGLALLGGGLIDGNGQKWWSLPCKPHEGTHGATHGPCDSPVALRFFMSSNVTVQGLKVQNSPEFHFRFDGCRNVSVSGVTVASPALSPNTDGIHVENTENVHISNTAISNGDDCISIGAGSYNVLIENVTCRLGHGISIGSLGRQGARACVANVTVRSAVIRHSDNGVRIKTWQGGSGSVTAVAFEDVMMEAVRNPIVVDQYYCLSRGGCANATSAVLVSGVTYRGVRGTYVDGGGGAPVRLGCSDAVPCTNITLADVELVPVAGGDAATAAAAGGAFCWNAYGSAATATVPPVPCLMDMAGLLVDIDSLKC